MHKRTYTRRQIREAIAYWENALKSYQSNMSLHESSDDEKSNEKQYNADKLLKMIKKMRPGAVMQFVSQELGMHPAKFLAKNAAWLAINAVKNGWTKTVDIAKAAKNYSSKSKEDTTGIDWDNVNVDEATIKLSCLFDGESGKKLKQFAKDLSKKMVELAKEEENKANKKKRNRENDEEDDGEEKDINESMQLHEDDNPASLDNIAAAVAIKAAKLAKDSGISSDEALKSLATWTANAAKSMDYDSDLTDELQDRVYMIFTSAESKDLKSLAKEFTNATAMKIADQMMSSSSDGSKLELTDYSFRTVKRLAKELAEKAADAVDSFNYNGPARVNLPDLYSKLGISSKDLTKILGGSTVQRNAYKRMLEMSLEKFMSGYEKDPTKAIKALLAGQEGAKADLLAELAAKLKPDSVEKFKELGININGKIDEIGSQMKEIADNADAANTPEKALNAAGDSRESAEELSNDKEAQEQTAKRAGIKSFTPLGWARLAAKTTGYILNHSKNIIDAMGAKKIKNKEDKNVIAKMNFVIDNAESSDSNYSDTHFSVRFDADDLQWHATCLDDRKMKFPEETLVKKALNTETGKRFKEFCLNKWKSIFNPDKTGEYAMLPFILNNIDKLGLKGGDKEFFEKVKLVSDKLNEIETKFNS